MNNTILAIGTYTDYVPNAPEANGEGILIVSFNTIDGTIKHLTTYKLINPSYISWSKSNRKLFSINKNTNDSGLITSFNIDDDYNLTPISYSEKLDKVLCFISNIDKSFTLFAVSYNGGSIHKFKLGSEGLTKKYTKTFIGKGPNKQRQEMPHAHQVVRDKHNKYIYVCDLGSDKIWIDTVENVTPNFEQYLEIPKGYGPRHLTFDNSGKLVYILCELTPVIIVAEVINNGLLKIVNEYPSTIVSSEKQSEPAAIKLHPSGKTIAVSNRVINTISIFKIVGKGLEFIDEFNCRGMHPRDINFSPLGDWLFIGNQDSNDIQIRAFDSSTGIPKDNWAKPYKVNTPTCIINIDNSN